MKKYMLFIAGLLCFVVSGEVEAKAVKLGRSVSSTSSTSGLNLSRNGTQKAADVVVCAEGCAKCESNTKCLQCKSGYYLKNGVCQSCPEYATCGGGTQTFSCDTLHYASGDICQDICYNVTCKTEGWSPMAKAGQCCCELKYCANSNEHKDEATNTCVSNCSGVTCNDTTYYQTEASSTGCCCKPKNCQTYSGSSCSKCNSGKWLNGGVCKTCPTNATCDGTGTFTCKSGYYKSGNSCTACPTGVAVCSSATTATSCKANYYLSGSSCTSCPSNATCSGGTAGFSCKANYYKNGNACTSCPAHATCSGGTASFSCNDNYRKSGSTCVACTPTTCVQIRENTLDEQAIINNNNALLGGL